MSINPYINYSYNQIYICQYKEKEEALETVNMLAEKDKKFGQYSLGMKQKLGIAQVLMEDPKVLILDEPFNGVEEKTAKKLREKLEEERSRGKLIIIASHIKEDIESLANIVYEFDYKFTKN